MENDNLTKQQINVVEDKSLSLKEIFHIIRKHIVAIIIFIVAGVGAAGVYTFFEPDEFIATASLIAMPDKLNSTNAAEYNGMSMIAETFVSFVSQNVVVNRAAELLKQEAYGEYTTATAAEVKSGLSVSNKNLIINVSFRSNDKQKSIDYVNAIVEAVDEIANTPLTDENGNIIYTTNGGVQEPRYKYPLLAGNLKDLSKAEKAPKNSHTFKNVAIGGALGLVLAAAYTIIFELLDNSFRNEQEVENELGLPILSVIPFYDIDSETKKGGKK